MQGFPDDLSLGSYYSLMEVARHFSIGRLRYVGEDSQRKILRGDPITGTQDNGPLDEVRQFPHIAWPVVVLQQLPCIRCDFFDSLAQAAAVVGQEVIGEGGDVLGAVSKWGERDGDETLRR